MIISYSTNVHVENDMSDCKKDVAYCWFGRCEMGLYLT